MALSDRAIRPGSVGRPRTAQRARKRPNGSSPSAGPRRRQFLELADGRIQMKIHCGNSAVAPIVPAIALCPVGDG